MEAITEKGFYVCHTNGSPIHFIDLSNGGKFLSGQESIERFDTLEDAKARVNELAKDETYFDENFAVRELTNAE